MIARRAVADELSVYLEDAVCLKINDYPRLHEKRLASSDRVGAAYNMRVVSRVPDGCLRNRRTAAKKNNGKELRKFQ